MKITNFLPNVKFCYDYFSHRDNLSKTIKSMLQD